MADHGKSPTESRLLDEARGASWRATSHQWHGSEVFKARPRTVTSRREGCIVVSAAPKSWVRWADTTNVLWDQREAPQ